MKIPFPRVMLCMMMLSGFVIEAVVAVGVPVGAPAAAAAAPASECCNVMELVPCANAFTSSTPPSAECCERLKEQRPPCICEYITDPALGGLINTPNAKMVSDSCGSPMPNNC
ncbi:non-specific lipid-transfer protein 2-like [Vigna radiata var. radiata]|uniref:Non-specific lipid-transfer protein 2-like n=1 Tax=Vigna radiata var. radiata TaxID=3916 RepID=A0A1S3UZI8_VIGRR|nr:non-specific lipid-transfer protein 2-like [Vigna radiata var. radiata]